MAIWEEKDHSPEVLTFKTKYASLSCFIVRQTHVRICACVWVCAITNINFKLGSSCPPSPLLALKVFDVSKEASCQTQSHSHRCLTHQHLYNYLRRMAESHYWECRKCNNYTTSSMTYLYYHAVIFLDGRQTNKQNTKRMIRWHSDKACELHCDWKK